MMASELFGTNIRATVTTSVPNFVRGAIIPVNIVFLYISKNIGIINSAIIIGIVCFTIAFISSYYLKETFGRDLDFIE